MSKSRQQNMVELLRFSGNSDNNPGMAVAVKIDPPGRNGVDDLAAIFRVQIYALGADYAQRFRINMRLRERMPDFQAGRGFHTNNSRLKCRANVSHSVCRLISFSSGIRPAIRTSP